MFKCNSYISFNICNNNDMSQLTVHIFLTCLNRQLTYFLSTHMKQHFTNEQAFHIFIHKSDESNAYQHIIITLMAYKSHTGKTHSLNISYSQIHTITHKSSRYFSNCGVSRVLLLEFSILTMYCSATW